MRRIAVILGLLVVLLSVSCGGGNGDDATQTPTAGAGATQSPTSGGSADATQRPSDGGSGSGSDFCGTDASDVGFDDVDPTLDPDALKDQFARLGGLLSNWENDAPGELKDDAKVYVAAIRGYIEVLGEHDFNFLALATDVASDPRVLALDSPEFQAAEARISEYCGWDTAGSTTGGGGSSTGGGSTGGFAVDLPDDFPEDLVPPDSSAEFVGAFGTAITAEFISTASIQDVVDYYKDTLGDPFLQSTDGVFWTVAGDSSMQTVTVSGTDGDVTIIILIDAS